MKPSVLFRPERGGCGGRRERERGRERERERECVFNQGRTLSTFSHFSKPRSKAYPHPSKKSKPSCALNRHFSSPFFSV